MGTARHQKSTSNEKSHLTFHLHCTNSLRRVVLEPCLAYKQKVMLRVVGQGGGASTSPSVLVASRAVAGAVAVTTRLHVTKTCCSSSTAAATLWQPRDRAPSTAALASQTAMATLSINQRVALPARLRGPHRRPTRGYGTVPNFGSNSPYEILGVRAGASKAEIKKAYLYLVKVAAVNCLRSNAAGGVREV